WATGRSAKASAERSRRFTSLDELIARTGLRRDEVVTLADLGALNAFGYDRRSALWQAERAIRPSGELRAEQLTPESVETTAIFVEKDFPAASGSSPVKRDLESASPKPQAPSPDDTNCPLKPMTEMERLVADYAGMGLSAGRHPMALKRDELAMRG